MTETLENSSVKKDIAGTKIKSFEIQGVTLFVTGFKKGLCSGNMKKENISEIVKNMRELKGLTQDELSELSGVPVRTLIRFEKGNNTTIDTLLQLLNALECQITISSKPEKE